MGRPRSDEPKEKETKEPARRSASRIEEDDSSENESQWEDDHVTEIFKDSDLYVAAKKGTLDDFERLLNRVSTAEHASPDDILWRLSPAANTFLHVAALHGNEDIVTFIAAKKPPLVLSKNFRGETALHFAAKAGDEAMVKALVLIHQRLLVLKPLPENEPDTNNLVRAKDKKGNTALHEALLNGQDRIAEYLIKEDPELSYHQNKDAESALYLAAKAGFANCISLILRLSKHQHDVNELFKKKSPIVAAVHRGHKDVLEALFDMNPSFIQLRDDRRRNPLHHAAGHGCPLIVRYLLSQCADNANQRDKKGSLPIHLAAMGGHVDVLRIFLQDCPDPRELLDRDGRNILHVAVKRGKSNVVSFVLNNPDLKSLINMKDKHGNTPLHLATKCRHPMIVHDLTWDKRVDVKVVNDKGMTALDVAELDISDIIHQRIEFLSWAALKAAGTPHNQPRKRSELINKSSMTHMVKEISTNFFLLVSTIVATVTFAAGFTVPGGYNSSESNGDPGMATMLRHKAFHVFVFSDIIAMYCSIVVVMAQFFIQEDNSSVGVTAYLIALHFFLISIYMMSVAFTAGLFLVVSKLRWLGTAVLVMGIIFHVLLFLSYLIMRTPISSRNRVVRYLSYYPFRWLILASGK